MYDTVILLTGPAEHSVFTTLLRGHNPSLTVLPVFTADDLAAIEPDWLGRARLISFSAGVIVPSAVLDRLGFGAYHFHPGSPDYPGLAAAQSAIDDHATQFGCTLHRIVERVGTGPIIETEAFEVPPGTSAAGLEEMAYTRLVQMFWGTARMLATDPSPLIERAIRWNGQHQSPSFDRVRRMPLVAAHRDTCKETARVTDLFGTDLGDNDQIGIVPSIGRPTDRFRIVSTDRDAEATLVAADI